jgi:archaellum biogenesis ATPase FlaH
MTIFAEARQNGKPSTEAVTPDQVSLVIEDMTNIRIRPVRWLAPSRIPQGKLVLIAGDGGNGKSTLTRSMVSSLSRGVPCLGMDYPTHEPISSLMFTVEDGLDDTVVPHLIAEGADLARVHHVPRVEIVTKGKSEHIPFRLEHIGLLRQKLKDHPEIRLIVIDPVISFIARMGLDENKSGDVRKLLDPLAALAEESGVTILAIAHVNKNSNAKARHRIAGNAAYVNASRLVYMVDIDPDDADRRLLMPVKFNILGINKKSLAFRLQPLTVEQKYGLRSDKHMKDLEEKDFEELSKHLSQVAFDGEVEANADEVMTAKKESGGNKVEKCAEWLKVFLKQYAYPSDEIEAEAAKSGFTKDNVFRAKSALKEHGLHNSNYGFQGRWWSGFGRRPEWTLRPSKTTPDIPDNQELTDSPEFPDNGPNSGVSGKSGVSGVSGESGATPAEWVPTVWE